MTRARSCAHWSHARTRLLQAGSTRRGGEEVDALIPELAYIEVANSLSRYVQARELPADEARRKLGLLLRLPLRATPLHELAPPALAVALARRVSAYDACYLVLAEAANAVLVTADRALADLAPRSALLPYDGPP